MRQFIMRRRQVVGLLATVMLFAFSTNSSALWPAGIYRFDAITGVVLDKETRKPIEGVVVVGHWGLEKQLIMGSAYTGPLVVKEAVTDKEGRFLITPTVTTDIHKSGHFNSKYFPEIAFFKSGFDFTVYRHSGKYPQNGIPPPFDTLNEDEYLMSRWLPDRKSQIDKWVKTIVPSISLTDTPGFCANYETDAPLLLRAFRVERERLAKTDAELAEYFESVYWLSKMESCIRKLQNGKKP